MISTTAEKIMSVYVKISQSG